MSNDIRIRVGVESAVRAGMEAAVRDVKEVSKQGMRKAGGDSGKGFAEAFGKVLRGDISGAIEDLQNRMGGGMKGLAAKMTVFGAGMATALFAGWKAGTKIDEWLGWSDKLSNALVKHFGDTEDELLRIQLKGLRKRREAMNKEMADMPKFVEFRRERESTPQEIEAANKGRADYLKTLPPDEQQMREDNAKRLRDIQEEADRKERIDQEQADIRKATARKILEDRLAAVQAKAGGINLGAMGEAANQAKADAAGAWRLALDPQARKDKRDEDREKAREEKRSEMLLRNALANRARGVRGGNIDAIIAAGAAAGKHNVAELALAAAEKQVAHLAKIEADLKKNLQMN